MTQYTVNGQTYNVAPEFLDRFVKKFPNAKKVATVDDFTMHTYFNKEGENWQQYNVRGDKLEKFKTKFPEARTKEGWEDYAEKQKKEIEAYNKRIADAKTENERKNLENQKIEDKRRADLQKEHRKKIESRFNKEIESQTSTFTINRSGVINKLRNLSYEDKIKWLNENTKDKYEAELSFEDPEFDIDESILDETKLDLPQKINVLGIESSQPENSEDTKLGDNFLEDVNKYNSDIQNILSNPILDEDGKVDYVKTQEAIDEIEANMPDGYDVRTDNIIEDLTKERDDIVSKIKNKFTTEYFKPEDLTEEDLVLLNRARELIGMSEEEYNSLLNDDTKEESWGLTGREKLFDKLKNELESKGDDDFMQLESTQLTLEERKQKLEQYKKGEIDLTTEELSNMITVDQGMKDYMKRFLPDPEQMVAMEDDSLSDDENALNAMNAAVITAVSADPRFKYIQDSIIKQVDQQAEAKLIEIRNKYKLNESITNEKLQKVQQEFTDWYNNSVGERLQGNESLKRLYKEYGLAANSQFEEMAIDYKRYKDPFLRKIDDTINRYEDDDSVRGELKEWIAKNREQLAKQPAAVGTWWNEAQIAVRDLFVKSPAKDYLSNLEMVSEALESVTSDEAKDLTLDEITELLGEESEAGKYAKWLRNIKIMDGDVKLGDIISQTESELEDVEENDMTDVKQMMEAYEEISKYKTYDSGKGVLTLEGFLDRTAGLIDQAPHMVPSMLGQGLVGGSALVTAATGGASTPATAITAGIGKGLILFGSMVQGAMEYGGTYMDGIRRGLTEELGREPTAEEYLEALKNPEKYTSQGAALTAGAAVTGTEFLSDYITGKLTGSVGGAIAETPVGKAILSNTITRYLASVGISGYGGMKLNAAQEYLTEGFQEYLGQVTDNYIDKFVQGKEMDSIFTSNIRMDEIEEAAKMGYKQGELFGGVALVSTGVGLSQIQKSYIQQAEDIAYGIDMRPGSSTSKAGRAAFQRLQKAIEDDDTLSKSEKARQIEELSRIREASMLTPSNVTGSEKFRLMKLLMEQKQLKNEIKSVDNKELSVNKIERKAEVDKQIIDIIKGADERSSTVGMSVLPTSQQQAADTKSEQDSYAKIDEIYADEDFDAENRFDQKRILKEAGGTINTALNRLWKQGSLLTREQFKTALENEYLKTFLSYNPEQDTNNQGIGQQTSNLFNLRANKIAKENIRQQGDTISMSDEKAPQIGDTTEQTDFDAESQQEVGRREKKYMADNTKVTEAVGEEATSQIDKETSQEILREAGKGESAEGIAGALARAFGQSTVRGGRGLFNIIGKKVGSLKKGFGDFVDNVVDRDFIAALPAAYLKQSPELQKILGLKKIGKTQVVKTDKDGKKTYSRPSVFAIPSDITDAQIQQVKDYFKKTPTTREGLLKRLSQEYSLSSINKLKQDKDFMQKLQTALGDKQNALDFLNEIEGKLDQRTLEDTTRDISAPKSAIDKLIASLEKKSKDYENIMLSSFGVPPPGLLYKYAAKALKAYKKVYKATGDFIKARKAWLKEFFKNFTYNG